MKTTKMLIGMISLMLMLISTSANAQFDAATTALIDTVLLNQNAAGEYANGQQIQVMFKQPVNITITSALSRFIVNNRVVSKGASNINVSRGTLTNVMFLIVKFTGADNTVSIKATANTTTYTAIYDAGVTAGKATCTGTKTEVLKSEQISVYPIPTEGDLNIEIDNSKLTTNVSDLLSGYYLIQILDMTGKVVKVEKLIKQ